MKQSLNKDIILSRYAEDKPFRMSDRDGLSMKEMQEITDGLNVLSNESAHFRLPRNRFYGGICLALPLSGLLWMLFYFLLQGFSN